MTWTYSGNPSSSTRDEVRFLVGDTDTTDQLVSDEEIAYSVAEQPTTMLAAALVAQSIASKFARKADKSVGDLSIAYSQQAKAYQDLEKRLRETAARRGSAAPYCGGISVSDKETVDADTDRVQPIFQRAEFNNLESDDPNNAYLPGYYYRN